MLRFFLYALLLLAGVAYAAEINVHVTGIEDEAQLKNVINKLGISKIDDPEQTTPRHIRQLYVKGEEDIREALKPFGYYQVEVTSDFERVDGDWNINYDVDLGPPIIISNINLVLAGPGANNAIFQPEELPFPLQAGDILHQPAYDRYKRELLIRADRNGYFDAVFTTQQILLDLDTNTAMIELIFNTGPEYYFGSITFNSEGYSEKLLRRFLIFKPGEEYSEDKVNELQTNMFNSGFFSSALVDAKRNDANDENEVPIEISLEPRKRFTYTAGVGYGTDTGARATAGVAWRRITETGHSAHLDLEPAQYVQTYSLRYRIPAQQPATDYYEIYAAQINEQPRARDLNSETSQLGFGWVKGAVMNDWQRIAQLTYQKDRFREKEGTTTTDLLLPSVGWETIRADTRFVPEQGYKVAIGIRGTSNAVSTTEFLQGDIFVKGIYSIFEDTRIISRAEVGATTEEKLSEIPPSLRFYAGGDNSVRGFAWQSLGCKELNNKGKSQNIGGSFLAVGSVEIERMIYRNFGIAGFYDIGNAARGWPEEYAAGAGIGFRYRTPIGMLRVDFATPISESTNQVRLHINIGPDL
jgi:translocation and assembly module TamA